ncbi:hypothetical protein [Marinibacterium sp. SX1]|uniref:hypothetical protein n=1 Tax=Marinibacterium sp. SX1 TaxID=3388424 RepID=UPI003D166C14
MERLDLEHARGSIARGLARQAMEQAACHSADTGAILAGLHAMAPNPRNRQRFAARLRGRPGVVQARPVADGLVVVLRTALAVDLRKEGQPCFCEDRIAWTRIHLRNGRRRFTFEISALHVTRHVLQRRVERSDCPLVHLLDHMDGAMLRAFARLQQSGMLTDRDDQYLLAGRGVWAGGVEETCVDPDWGPAFRQAAPMKIFAIRTFLAESEMRPTVWLGWSEAREADKAA